MIMDSLISLESASAGVEAALSQRTSSGSAREQREAPGKEPENAAGECTESCVLKLKGLPYSAGESAIREFFSGYTVKEVAFVYEPDGRPSGLAFAEFSTREEALQAMSKNGAYIGERYVRLLHVPKQEMLEQVRLGTLAIPGNAHRRSKLQQQQQQRSSFDHMQQPRAQQHATYVMDSVQLPHGAVVQVPQRVLELPQSYPPAMQAGAVQGAPVQMVAAAAAGPNGHIYAMAPGQMGQLVQMAPGGMAMQMAPASMPMAQVVQQDSVPVAMANGHMGVQQVQMAPPHMALAYQMGAMSLGGPLPRGPGPTAPHHAQQQRQQQQQPGPPVMAPSPAMAPNGYSAANSYAATNGYPATNGYATSNGYPASSAFPPAVPVSLAPPAPGPVMVIGTDSKTVKIRGLPFRATPLDIFNFFEGYDHIVESLQLGVDALGRPSGEAWLMFTSAEEALRAVRERNRHYLGNRYLELSLA